MIILGPEQYNDNMTATLLSADLQKGQNNVRVASTKGFEVGQTVLLDEASSAGGGATSRGWAKSGRRRITGWCGKAQARANGHR